MCLKSPESIMVVMRYLGDAGLLEDFLQAVIAAEIIAVAASNDSVFRVIDQLLLVF